tara:strand:+ start:207 stop:875 length:669 start_codon:yes stop_codon:yes gene_type:complete
MRTRNFVLIAVVLIAGSFIFFRSTSESPDATVSVESHQTTIKVEQPQPVEAVVEESFYRTTFDPNANVFTGEFIVGEGEHAGQIEMVGSPAVHVTYGITGASYERVSSEETKSIVMTEEDGKYHLPVAFGQTDTSIRRYLTLSKKEGQPPVFHVWDNDKKLGQQALYPRYQATHLAKTKMTPHLTNGAIFSGIERKIRMKGQVLEGFVWCVKSRQEQMYADD